MDEKELEEFARQVQNASVSANAERTGVMQQRLNYMQEEHEKSLATEQLDLSKELLNFYYQLHGYTLKPNDSGELIWAKDSNDDLSFLTEEGRNYCFWFVQGYLTKNLLLSNYDEATILQKMEDLSNTLNDTLFIKYDTYFRKPTIDECKAELKKRIQEKIDLRKFVNEISNLKEDEEKVKKEIIKEFEQRIDDELNHIRMKLMADKRKMFESLIRIIQDTIHSAYLRAWKGQERTTLRQHINISETKGGLSAPHNSGVSLNPLNFFRGKK